MSSTRVSQAARRGAVTLAKTQPARKASRKVSKTYRLDEARVEAARRALGAKTATEAIETALDLVLFRQELVEGTRRMLGVRIQRSEEDDAEARSAAAPE